MFPSTLPDFKDSTNNATPSLRHSAFAPTEVTSPLKQCNKQTSQHFLHISSYKQDWAGLS